MKRWLSISLLLVVVTSLFGRQGGDVVSLSGDSLRIAPIIKLTLDGVVARDLHNDKSHARNSLEEALRVDSMDYVANYQMARLLLSDNVAEAIPYAKRAMEGDSTNKWCMELYAQSLVMSGNYNLAKPIYQKLIECEPSNADFYRVLAILHQYTERPYSAIMVLDSAELRIGQNPYLSRIKHNLLLSTKQEGRAESEAQEMVANTPYDISSRLLLAEAYAAGGRDSLAEVEYRVALDIDATSADALMGLCRFYESRGRTRDYIETLKELFNNEEYQLSEALSLMSRMMGDGNFYRANYVGITELISTLALRYPKDKDVVELRAAHLINSGMLDSALEVYKSHIADNPPVLDYFMSVIEIESYKKRADSVSLYVNRALEKFPDNIELYITKAGSRAYDKDYEGAKRVYREGLSHSTSDSLSSRIWGYIGDVDYQMSVDAAEAKHKKRAMKRCYEAYDRALELDSVNITVLNNYAYFLSEQHEGDYTKALALSERVVAIDKNNPVYLDTYAWILYKLGRYEEAGRYMRTAISLDKSKNAELPLHYGDILAAQGEKFMAEIYWRRAEALGYSKEEIEKRVESLKEQSK